MLNNNEEQFLLNALKNGRVNLFLGAGFNFGVKNRNGLEIPSTNCLINKLQQLLGLEPEDKPEDSLQIVYELALRKLSKEKVLKPFLQEVFQVHSVPNWMNIIPSIIWRKILTTNIDNAMEVVYSNFQCTQKLCSVDAMLDPIRERDQTFQKVLKISLHGSLRGAPEHITFSTMQYASRSNEKVDPWYQDFLSEYAAYPFLIIGSRLEEQVLWQYLEARGKRYLEKEELRPKSFLIIPKMSEARKQLMKDFNVHHVSATAKEFFEWLDQKLKPRPAIEEVLMNFAPHILVTHKIILKQKSKKTIRAANFFFSLFQPVIAEPPDPSYVKTSYHHGAIPTWQDISHKLDADREITKELSSRIKKNVKDEQFKVFMVFGTAGAGKSTIARRLAVDLTKNNLHVIFNESGRFPKKQYLSAAMEFISDFSVIVVDDAYKNFGQTIEFVDVLKDQAFKGSLVLISRIGSSDKFDKAFKSEGVHVDNFFLANLSRSEIEGVISVLGKTGMLGKLQGMNQSQRIKEFEKKAQKQLLVALKEATSGRGFDEIINGEYNEVSPIGAKLLYLLGSLVTAHHHSIDIRYLINSFDLSPAECLSFLKHQLKGLLIDWGTNGQKYFARHPLIAEQIVQKSANRNDLLNCYLEILPKLGKALRSNRDDKIFRLYKGLINHEAILRRFGKRDRASGRKIFESIKHLMNEDFHFWLQYSNYELGFKEFSLAKTYIESAESLCLSKNYTFYYIQLTKIQINLEEALYVLKDSKDGEEIFFDNIKSLEELIRKFGSSSPNPYHVFAHCFLLWVMWYIGDEELAKKYLKRIQSMIEKGLSEHWKNPRLEDIDKTVKRQLLQMSAGLDWRKSTDAENE